MAEVSSRRLTRDAIVAAARGWIGTPYHHQQSLKGAGCDCLGLVRGVWREVIGVEPETPPAYTPDWAEGSGEETLLAACRRWLIEKPLRDAMNGDVAVWRMRPGAMAKHCGILADGERIIHARQPLAVLDEAVADFLRSHRRARIAAVFAFPGA